MRGPIREELPRAALSHRQNQIAYGMLWKHVLYCTWNTDDTTGNLRVALLRICCSRPKYIVNLRRQFSEVARTAPIGQRYKTGANGLAGREFLPVLPTVIREVFLVLESSSLMLRRTTSLRSVPAGTSL